MNNKIKSNLLYAFFAQGISLIVSCLTNLILPKFITPLDFSYWQLFIFYATYIPCLALGVNDGVYLRYGGFNKRDLNYQEIKSQYIFSFLFQFVFASIITLLIFLFWTNTKREWVILLVIIYFIFYTCHNFLGYIFQAVNETNVYSKSIIVDYVFYVIFQILLIMLGKNNIFYFIIFYTIGVAISFEYLFFKIRPNFKKVKFNFKLGRKESFVSIKTGISLMISNVCALLVLGVGRQIVDIRWGLLVFGKISFSITLINFALTFISQIGMVLFPALRRLDSRSLNVFFLKISKYLFNLLPLMYIVYLPGQFILKLWLPQYITSIDYLSIVLPICFFDSKMNLIGNTFFKVLSKQVTLLKINIETIIISSLIGLTAAYVFNSLKLLVIGLVIAIAFRSIFSEILVSKYLGVNVVLIEIFDVFLALVFMLISNLLTWYISLIIMLILCVIRFIALKSGLLIYSKI